MPDGNDFTSAIRGKKIPVLVLDQKWHKLFALGGKSDDIIALEAELNQLLKRQGLLSDEQKKLKKTKNKLMASVVKNMEGANEENKNKKSSKILKEDKRQLDEVNEELEQVEDELLDMPRELNRVNGELMLETMKFCYDRLRQNRDETQEIKDWIDEIRVELKRKIIKKQNREISSRQIYTYMHDIFGPQVLDIFDLHFDKVIKAEEAKETDDEKEGRTDKVTVKGTGNEEKPVENFETTNASPVVRGLR